MRIPALINYPLVFKQVVAWGDMDAFGHVNNVQYYRYIESARIAYLSQLNIFNLDIYTVIASSNCRYLSPVIYPDVLHIGARVEELRQSAMRMSYVLYSEQQQKIVAEGEAVIVCLDKSTLKKSNMPIVLKQQIIQIEATVEHVIDL
ncbi:MAG: acyl-CoA thioesterase [Acinetobacter populi]|jgi:acyl-CoA thioester hydrolase|uniref:acyl-CoA thioesterase n=1 Tax=Acinetobacter populi TaxID=1582270 RepID=UPI002356AC08|nr:acyl-CoA thioesterase [Acinetobacter populi]MCH4248130.1 acyl-CoA thioesterase [Acinetobacter populi]